MRNDTLNRNLLWFLLLCLAPITTNWLSCRSAIARDQQEDQRYRIGINFSPFEDHQSPLKRVRIEEAQLVRRLKPLQGYAKVIRTYGVTGGLENIPRVARTMGLETWAGAWLSSDLKANEREIDNLIRIGREGLCPVLIVGSEVLLRGDLSEDALIGYIQRVRDAVPPKVKVTTADTYGKLLEHPRVVAASQIVFLNTHPYWEGTAVERAMMMLHAKWPQLVAMAQGKPLIISEIGWPSGGETFGRAVPSPENAARFFLEFTTWARSQEVEFFWFSAADERWKNQTGEGAAGQFWGLFHSDGITLKPGMQMVFDGKQSSNTWSVPDLPGGPGTPEITFTYVPPLGASTDLAGTVRHLRPAEHKVVVYIRVNGQWWIKPTLDRPSTPIEPDGAWECDITTGGLDRQADMIAAYVIPASIEEPSALGDSTLPVELSRIAVASVKVHR